MFTGIFDCQGLEESRSSRILSRPFTFLMKKRLSRPKLASKTVAGLLFSTPEHITNCCSLVPLILLAQKAIKVSYFLPAAKLCYRRRHERRVLSHKTCRQNLAASINPDFAMKGHIEGYPESPGAVSSHSRETRLIQNVQMTIDS